MHSHTQTQAHTNTHTFIIRTYRFWSLPCSQSTHVSCWCSTVPACSLSLSHLNPLPLRKLRLRRPVPRFLKVWPETAGPVLQKHGRPPPHHRPASPAYVARCPYVFLPPNTNAEAYRLQLSFFKGLLFLTTWLSPIGCCNTFSVLLRKCRYCHHHQRRRRCRHRRRRHRQWMVLQYWRLSLPCVNPNTRHKSL